MTTLNHSETETLGDSLSFDEFKREVLEDYRLACLSRHTSLIGRKEVLTGKAKFGIFSDGKEIPQIALSKFFQPGDWRTGYYRDQTFSLAIGLATVEEYFSQLYGDPNEENDPNSAGRQMIAHYSSPNIDENAQFLNLSKMNNTAADVSPTSSHIPRAIGLAAASKLFRNDEDLKNLKHLSNNGNEVCFATIGDASTSEGHFWETVNAAGVLQVPIAFVVWDDGYGISVPRDLQTTKDSISRVLSGFEKNGEATGLDIYTAKGWDYAELCEVFEKGVARIRENHTPALFHIQDLTQPQGHSTSGSHERYKSKERLAWEEEWDCNAQMRSWILGNSLAEEEDLVAIEEETLKVVKQARDKAYKKYQNPIKEQVKHTVQLCNKLLKEQKTAKKEIKKVASNLINNKQPLRYNVLDTLSEIQTISTLQPGAALEELREYYKYCKKQGEDLYNSHLYASGANSALEVEEVKPVYSQDSPSLNGYEVLNRFFDKTLENNSKVFAFGEDVGQIGDVNQGFMDLQKKHGSHRVFDTGIRELTIIGQATGMALRGLRPIAEIQYLDYILFALEQLSDDAATMQYRTKGQQFCPIIVRTRGHRLEGIWHSGSPMGILMNSLRGMRMCVPRNMVKAAGMYNTLLKANDPGLVIECLNGYRLKEKLPDNIAEQTVPLGVPEVIHSGEDITIVSYGSILRLAMKAVKRLEKEGISCELIDVQTLLPFDRPHRIVESLKKTSRILFLDEDVPGGATAFMYRHVMEEQGGYRYLDTKPQCLTSTAHRPAYGSDGDYFSKPNAVDIYERIVEMMKE
ncbi:MAG TPA: thiamine pyrophosphate-dependent enzyme [Chitinophagaceae bacterium]|nr:thiamine pyrophosphate-dependent enzyme [Chitinophagaceae bacterium]